MSHDATIQLISLALDASMMRQTAIANNIANANTIGYHTQSINFEQQLAAQPLINTKDEESGLENIKPFYEECETNSPIDEQLALGVKNATQYRALIKGLNHKLAIMKLALQGNNQS